MWLGAVLPVSSRLRDSLEQPKRVSWVHRTPQEERGFRSVCQWNIRFWIWTHFLIFRSTLYLLSGSVTVQVPCEFISTPLWFGYEILNACTNLSLLLQSIDVLYRAKRSWIEKATLLVQQSGTKPGFEARGRTWSRPPYILTWSWVLNQYLPVGHIPLQNDISLYSPSMSISTSIYTSHTLRNYCAQWPHTCLQLKATPV